MASLTIPFPEGTRTITLRGTRITVGRLPDNTIQIRDRTISAYHAELIEEGDHYRVHDKSSTNGLIVGGQRVTDYHLREDCQVNLGGLACEFRAAAEEEKNNELDTIPTRSEMLTVLQANGDLRTEVAALRGQIETMTKAREAGATTGASVPLEQHDQLAAEVASLRASLQEKQTQIERLTSLLAIANRERDSLQKGYDDARAALHKEREGTPAKLAKTEPAAPANAAPSAPSVPGTSPASIPAPPAAPKLPPPTAGGIKPAGAPAIPAAPAPSGPAAPRPLPKPPGSIGSGSPSRRPASGVQPAVAKPVGPAAGLVAAGIGPKGTQKLVE
jgi:pSer/pThr/pTyr-binding forkhead associated (FHA) protein